jgi:FkbM family methyltransferase
LFTSLLRTFEVGIVCDVGSLDGSEALRFRRVLPSADIIALEPNPRSFALMQADERLRSGSIRLLPLAASNRDAEAPFFVVEAEYAANRDLARRGTSSLYERTVRAEAVQVRTVRLDRLLADEARLGSARRSIALWIDTEGMAFETISGAAGVLESIEMLHVEVETAPCIADGQRLFPDVERLLASAGFVLLATDQPRDALQFNALFVRGHWLRTKAAEIRLHAAAAGLQRRLKRSLRPLVPRRLRRLLRWTWDTTRVH